MDATVNPRPRAHVPARRSTPWGTSDSKEVYAKGVTFYSTPSHGGFKVAPILNATIHPALRREDGWYEEDCEYHRVVLAFPGLFVQTEVDSSREGLKRWSPDAYEAWTGEVIPPGESCVKDERAWHEAHADDLVSISCFGDQFNGVPAGHVGVVATRGGKRAIGAAESWWIVPAEKYERRERFGFVVDPAKCAPWTDPRPYARKEA